MRRPTDLIDRIADDLRSKKLTFPASEAVLLRDYARAGQLPWREYRVAARIAGEEDGTLVVVDDFNKCLVGDTDFEGVYDGQLGNRFVADAVNRYLTSDARASRAREIVFTLYRLPRGSYGSMPHEFFRENADYIGDLTLDVEAYRHQNADRSRSSPMGLSQ